MNCTVTLDWKGILALGAVICGTIFAAKMNAKEAENVSIHLIDAFLESNMVGETAIDVF